MVEDEIVPGWRFLEQKRGVVEGKPVYNPVLWRNLPGYAKDKIKQVQAGLKNDGVLYPEILTTMQVSYRPGDSILDAGCAGGHYYATLHSELSDIDYTGIDITPEYIDSARDTYPEKTWKLGDVRKLPFPDKSFDHVLCLFVLVHLDESGVFHAMNELTRVARKQILLAGYFSFTRLSGAQRTEGKDFIYDIVDSAELERPGWDMQATHATADHRPKSIKVPVESKKADGTWEENEVELPVFSYVRMVRKVEG